MKIMNFNKSELFSFVGLFLALFLVFFVASSSEFEEDGNYIKYVQSMGQDYDYNLINQVDHKMTWLLTSSNYHPNQHSEIQTPVYLTIGAFEVFLRYFISNDIKAYKLTSILIMLLASMIGFFYIHKALEVYGLKFSKNNFLFFCFSTSYLYFSIFSLSTIEVFSFALMSYVFFGASSVYFNGEDISPVGLGLGAGLLLVSKILYVPLFILTLFSVSKWIGKDRKNVILFIVSTLLVILPSCLNSYVQNGRVLILNSWFAPIVNEYSFYNVIETIKTGYFGVGGFFYTNPLYLPVFIILTYKFCKKVFIEKDSVIFYVILYMWLGAGYFQSIFLTGPVVDDLYGGRLTLTSLPLLLMGLAYLNEYTGKKIKYFLIPVLILWQFFTMINFMVQFNKRHYEYSRSKFAGSLSEVFEMLNSKWLESVYLLEANFPIFLLFILFSTVIIILLTKYREILSESFHYFLISLVTLLIIFSFFNFKFGPENTKILLSQENPAPNRVITNDPKLMLYTYAIDMLRSQHINAKDEKMRTLINQKRRDYYDSIKQSAKTTTPEFQEALDNYDFKYGYYELFD